MRLLCGSAGCQFNGPSNGLSRTKSKFQRFESDSVWRWSSSAACCRASSGDDGKPKRHRLTRDKQPVLGTIRGRPPPKREYEGNIILTSSETGAARTRVLMMIQAFQVKIQIDENGDQHTTPQTLSYLEKSKTTITPILICNESLCENGGNFFTKNGAELALSTVV